MHSTLTLASTISAVLPRKASGNKPGHQPETDYTILAVICCFCAAFALIGYFGADELVGL